MYNCSPQIPRVIQQLQAPGVIDVVSGVVCVDNRSNDETVAVAQKALEALNLPVRILLQNDDNYGLGGSHKVAINLARREGFSHLIVLHGDDQGSISDILPILQDDNYDDPDFLMGARFMPGSKLEGYSLIRTWANHAFNLIFSVLSGKRLYDLGSGLNLFRVSAFDNDFHIKFADNLTFNYYLILAIVARQHRVRFFPLSWREDDQISNAKLSRMGFQILDLLRQRAVNRNKFFVAEHRENPRDAYPSTELVRWRR
jgi:glycosyltransferase involved in cell wall biosynthesis